MVAGSKQLVAGSIIVNLLETKEPPLINKVLYHYNYHSGDNAFRPHILVHELNDKKGRHTGCQASSAKKLAWENREHRLIISEKQEKSTLLN